MTMSNGPIGNNAYTMRGLRGAALHDKCILFSRKVNDIGRPWQNVAIERKCIESSCNVL
jgi:hypothetical protein